MICRKEIKRICSHETLGLAVGLNLLFLTTYLFCCVVQQASLDDYFMSAVLTGAYGSTYDVHLYFINVIFGYVLKPFYLLFPKVSWYFIFEVAEVFVSLTVISYLFVYRGGLKWGGILAFMFLSCVAPDYYSNMNFTQCALILTAAGVVLFSFGDFEKKWTFLLLGSVLLISGFVMRFHAFLLGLPFLALLCGFNLVDREIRWKTIVSLVLCSCCICILYCFDKEHYRQDDYKYYAAYQGPRAFFGDGGYYDIESAYDELEERGMHGRDLHYLRAWDFYDTDVFSLDSVQKIAEIVSRNNYVPNGKRMIAAFFIVLSNSFSRQNTWCWTVFCFLLILFGGRRGLLYPWASLGLIGICIGYLLWVNRVAPHVESGIWLYAIVSSTLYIPQGAFFFCGPYSRYARISCVGLLFLSLCFVVLSIPSYIHTERNWVVITPSRYERWVLFDRFAEKHRDDVFLLDFDSYKSFATTRDPAYLSVAPGSWQNIFPIGYWNIHLPAMKKELKERGVSNPLKDITKKNVFVVEGGNYPRYKSFYATHYHKELSVDTIGVFDGLPLLKYREKGNVNE